MQGVSSRWGSQAVLTGVNLEIYHQEIFGILGPNDSGKSTLLAILASAIAQDEGKILFSGRPTNDLRLYRSQVGFMPDLETVPEEFTVLEYLKFYSQAYGLNRSQAKRAIPEALATSELSGQERVLVSDLSPMEFRHLSLSRVLLHDPKLLILDEPLSGLSLDEERSIMNRLESFLSRERAIVFSSTDFDETARAAHRLALLESGQILSTGAPEKILEALEMRTNDHA